ncbi:alpha/beta hydrolase [bacterium]|nr:alpha/beta hydrolase [bacterium]
MPYFNHQSHRIHYRQAGDGPLMVILPGNTASSVFHQGDLAYFSQWFTVVSLDYLGTGLSDRVESESADWYADCADQAAALISHLDLGQAVLLGTSGGAVVALHGAARHPDLVRAVIADSFTPEFTPEMLQQNVIGERSNPTDDQAAFWQAAHGEDWLEVVQADTAMLTDMVAGGGRWLGDALHQVTCPVLLTASLEDPMLVRPAEYALDMLAELQDGRAFINQHGGHPLMWSAPKEFHRAISGFLAQFHKAED